MISSNETTRGWTASVAYAQIEGTVDIDVPHLRYLCHLLLHMAAEYRALYNTVRVYPDVPKLQISCNCYCIPEARLEGLKIDTLVKTPHIFFGENQKLFATPAIRQGHVRFMQFVLRSVTRASQYYSRESALWELT